MSIFVFASYIFKKNILFRTVYNRRKRKKATDNTWVGDVLKRKRLTKDAFPSIWPGAPSYLSKISLPRNTNLSTSEARRENVETMVEMADIEEARSDKFKSLDECDAKKFDDYILLIKLAVSDPPSVLYSIKHSSHLSFDVWYEQNKMKGSRLKSIVSKDLNTCTAVTELLGYLEINPYNEKTEEEVVQEIISKLQDQRFDGNIKIPFLAEQLGLLFKIPTAVGILHLC